MVEGIGELISNEFDHISEKLDELGYDFEAYRTEYSELYNSVVSANLSINNLHSEIERLENCIEVYQEDFDTLKLREGESRESISLRETDIVNTRRNIKYFKDKIEENSAALTSCKDDIATLSHDISNGIPSKDGPHDARRVLEQDIDLLQQELNKNRDKYSNFVKELEDIEKMVQSRDFELSQISNELKTVEQQCESLNEAIDREHSRKTLLEDSLQRQKSIMAEKHSESVEQQSLLKAEIEAASILERELHENKHEMELYFAEYDVLYNNITDLDVNLQKQRIINSDLKSDNVHKIQRVSERRANVLNLKKEHNSLKNIVAQLMKDFDSMTQHRIEIESNRENLQKQIYILGSVNMKNEQKSKEMLLKQVNSLRRQRDVLEQKSYSCNSSSSKLSELTKVSELACKNLNDEISTFKTLILKKRGEIQNLISENQKLELESSQFKLKLQEWSEKLKSQDIEVEDLKHKIHDNTVKLKQQQTTYEDIKSERNMYNKEHQVGLQSIQDMKKKFKLCNYEIESLKKDVLYNSHYINRETDQLRLAEKSKNNLKNEILKLKKQIDRSNDISVKQDIEIKKLLEIINEADHEKKRQIDEREAILREKNTILTQLVKRNNEMSSINDKIKIQATELMHDETYYNQLCRNMKVLQDAVKSLERELSDVVKTTKNNSGLVTLTGKLESDLQHEKIKVRVITDELNTPLNIHRWRGLQTSDPERFEMIRHVRSLQLQLKAKTKEIDIKNEAILQQEKMYVELRSELSRYPETESAEQLKSFHNTLKTRAKQMRNLEADLDISRHAVEVLHEEIEKSCSDIKSLNQAWINQMEYQWRKDNEFEKTL